MIPKTDAFKIETPISSDLYLPYPAGTKQKKQMNYQKGEAQGKWSQTEKMHYLAFIEFLHIHQIGAKAKRSMKVFKAMSLSMKTRNLLQCRSHHQKLLQRYKGVSRIIKKVKKQLCEEQYEAFYRQKEQAISEMCFPKGNKEISGKIKEEYIEQKENDQDVNPDTSSRHQQREENRDFREITQLQNPYYQTLFPVQPNFQLLTPFYPVYYMNSQL